MSARSDENARLTDADLETIKAAYRRHLPHGGVPGAWPRCFTHATPVDQKPDHVVEVIAPAVEVIVAERRCADMARALRGQRDFFLSIDMPAAADYCEQAAIGWESQAVTDALRLRPGKGDAQ